ncbi:MAG: restriction endonuclease [Rhodobacteraceae bacterium]|nr:restriction endonuclease [Paracoccaceae bacterium]
MDDLPFQGRLFSPYVLEDYIKHKDTKEWHALPDAYLGDLHRQITDILAPMRPAQEPNEDQTKDEVILPILQRLGWSAYLLEQNLSPRGRKDVPDGLLFADEAQKDKARHQHEQWERYQFGCAMIECKRYALPLDRGSLSENAPSTQMLRYLRRAETMTGGKLLWGILTNGQHWRLYWQQARSVSEDFFEIDLPAILRLPEEQRTHWLKVFVLMFSRTAFVPAPEERDTFHIRALNQGKVYEARVAEDLSQLVSDTYPRLARALDRAAPEPLPPEQLREATLILLYRLLFILYAEDRTLLPVNKDAYQHYSLRRVREELRDLHTDTFSFSSKATIYWDRLQSLCRMIDKGDAQAKMPPYNGGLFDSTTPAAALLNQVKLPDQDMAELLNALSYHHSHEGRKYINYRNLSVQQLGSIYERLLEQELIRTPAHQGSTLTPRLNIFARKGSGSYYTPDDLVRLIISETLEPLIEARTARFEACLKELRPAPIPPADKGELLQAADPAAALLELKICDPAMGSGHFLVNLVNYLADEVIDAMEKAPAHQDLPKDWAYVSPLANRIEEIRNRILANAQKEGWEVDKTHLEDRHIIRRMVLKRCIYGVDKNPMAVELAKVALWLDTFTVGAPLSFLDHHLRCGDSLFGSWVSAGIAKAQKGGKLLLGRSIESALQTTPAMQQVEQQSDADIAEVKESARKFAEVREGTAPLDALLRLLHGLEWQPDGGAAQHLLLDGQMGDPLAIALGDAKPVPKKASDLPQAEAIVKALELVKEENFLNWQVAFPGVWHEWETGLHGGFDAVVGNPPWDRIKLQQVEWFAQRRPQIARATRAADRKQMIAALEREGDPLAQTYAQARERVEARMRMARKGGDYPLLSRGDINIYALFVERALQLVRKADFSMDFSTDFNRDDFKGYVGLLVPSGIVSDKTAAKFFQSVVGERRLRRVYDFQNARTKEKGGKFFADVASNFKLCVFVASSSPVKEPAEYAFFLRDVKQIEDKERVFTLNPEDIKRLNPNTGTLPVFRSTRDAELTKRLYQNAVAFANRTDPAQVEQAWILKYLRMFDMTNDSNLFRTREELEEQQGGYPLGGNLYGSPQGQWLPLWEGKTIHQFDHRAASVIVNKDNLHNAALSDATTDSQKANPDFTPTPQYWVPKSAVNKRMECQWAITFRDVTNATSARTMIATIVPKAGFGNSAPLLLPKDTNTRAHADLIVANFNSIAFDFAARNKVHGNHMSYYILEQLPMIVPARFHDTRFGAKTAAQILRDIVLELTYTAHDLAPFARDMGYVDGAGTVLPPFTWKADRRLRLRAKLDAVFFHLYGMGGAAARDDIRHIYESFTVVKKNELAAYGSYRSLRLCLGYVNALGAGDPDAKVEV